MLNLLANGDHRSLKEHCIHICETEGKKLKNKIENISNKCSFILDLHSCHSYFAAIIVAAIWRFQQTDSRDQVRLICNVFANKIRPSELTLNQHLARVEWRGRCDWWRSVGSRDVCVHRSSSSIDNSCWQIVCQHQHNNCQFYLRHLTDQSEVVFILQCSYCRGNPPVPCSNIYVKTSTFQTESGARADCVDGVFLSFYLSSTSVWLFTAVLCPKWSVCMSLQEIKTLFQQQLLDTSLD